LDLYPYAVPQAEAAMTEPPLKLENYMAVATKVHLLPCPFCGEQVALTNVRMSGHSFAIGCYNESCWRPRTDYYDSEAAVTDAWNTRTPDITGQRQRAENPSVIAEIPSHESPQVRNGASDSSLRGELDAANQHVKVLQHLAEVDHAAYESTLTALQGSLSDLITKWRENADMLAEGNKDEHFDPSVGMQRSCADELSAVLAGVRVPQDQQKIDDDVTRSGRLAVDPSPQPAATDRKG
jgi:hypothetical protein